MWVAPPLSISSSVSSNSACVMGQGQHDVAADVLEACPPRGCECRPRLPGCVGAAQRFQLAIPCGLDAEGDAVDAGFPEGAERCLGDRFRVGFQRDLGTGEGRRCRDQPGGILRGQQAGGAAAEIEGVRAERGIRRKAVQFPQQGVHVCRGDAPLAGCGIEIAVPAFGNSRECGDKVQETRNITAFFMKRSFLCSILYFVDRGKAPEQDGRTLPWITEIITAAMRSL